MAVGDEIVNDGRAQQTGIAEQPRDEGRIVGHRREQDDAVRPGRARARGIGVGADVRHGGAHLGRRVGQVRVRQADQPNVTRRVAQQRECVAPDAAARVIGILQAAQVQGDGQAGHAGTARGMGDGLGSGVGA